MPDARAIFILTLRTLNPQIDSDLASSHGSSRGSSPFLPPAMPLLQVKSVPVLEPYNEAAIDCPPELLAASSQAGSGRASPSKCQACWYLILFFLFDLLVTYCTQLLIRTGLIHLCRGLRSAYNWRGLYPGGGAYNSNKKKSMSKQGTL